ncbi:putative anion transporter 4, chloroplastic [Holothuria leucospilota]|uniref:Anion transporter 4, chloroplastic n=1 Tax=Holothuria leucospilota TaxID=206669 RepID=A0A9Q1C6V8_HOLLE|nr:putative anion transporter 4, chloroplastic [Holothuria leucospilota]
MKMSKTQYLIFLCGMANFINAADRVIMPIAIVPMSDLYHWDLQLQGWILSAFAYGYISSQVLGGKAAQRFGGRAVLGIAVACWSFATFITPMVASQVHIVIFLRILLGFAEGFCLPTIFHVFSCSILLEERSKAFGYLVAGGSVGQCLASVICPYMSWPDMFYTFGAIGFVWVLLWFMLYTKEMDGVNSDPQKLMEQKVDTTSQVNWRSYISHRPLWAIYFAHFCMNTSNYIISTWLPTYLQKTLGANPHDISFTALPFIANSIVGVVAGHRADYLIAKGSWTVLSVRRLMTGIGLLGPAVFVLLFGSVSSVAVAISYISISLGLCACNSAGHLSNHGDVAPHHSGITFAVSNTLATLPGLTAGPVTAAAVDYFGTWTPVFLAVSLVNVAGAVVYITESSASQVL